MPYLTREQVEQTRMPAEWKPPQQLTNPFSMMGGMGGMGGGKGAVGGYAGDPLGMIDPAALAASAQGGDYDMEGRRNAIAARILANQQAQGAAQQGHAGGAGGGRGSGQAVWGEEMQTPYGPVTRNPDPTSPLIGMMGIDPETGPTFF